MCSKLCKFILTLIIPKTFHSDWIQTVWNKEIFYDHLRLARWVWGHLNINDEVHLKMRASKIWCQPTRILTSSLPCPLSAVSLYSPVCSTLAWPMRTITAPEWIFNNDFIPKPARVVQFHWHRSYHHIDLKEHTVVLWTPFFPLESHLFVLSAIWSRHSI